MSVWTEFLISAAIIVSIAMQFGTRTLSWRRLLVPLLIVTGFAVYYLKAIPTSGGDGMFTLAGVVIGVALGTLAGVLMRVRKDAGRVVTSAGIAYVALWVITFGARFAFVQIATSSPATLSDLFIWAYRHGVTEAGWTAFFMLQALLMIAVRTAIVAGRAYLGPAEVAVKELGAI